MGVMMNRIITPWYQIILPMATRFTISTHSKLSWLPVPR